MKQTAIEWLVSELRKPYADEFINKIIEQAKEMEEQNHLDLIRFLRTQDKMGKSVEDLLEQFKKK